MDSNECVVCNGQKYDWCKSHRCEKHDICDKCKKKRSELEKPHWGTRTGFICGNCKEENNKKYIDDYQKTEPYSFDFSSESYIKCPYCGYENDASDTHESDDDYECGRCDSNFEVEVEYSTTYTTTKKDA